MRQAIPRPSLGLLVVAAAVLAAVVAALVAALVLVRTHDGRPRASAGDVYDHPFQEDPLPHRAEVLLPWARTQVSAGGPRAELPTVLGAEASVRAPEGGSFVRVDVELGRDHQVPLAAVGTPYVGQTEVVLRADGRDYPLTGPGGLDLDPNGYGQRGGTRWVAVEGRPSDLEVLLTVDGVTQVVQAADGRVEAGRAADLADLPALEDLPGLPSTDCGEPERLDDTALRVDYLPGLDCEVSLVLRTPYVDGLGWAPPDREFVVVQVVRPRRLSLVGGDTESGGFWDSTVALSATLGGAEPLAPEVDVDDLSAGLGFVDPDDPVQLLFDVPAGEPLGDLVLDLVADATLGAPFVTEQQQVVFRWTVPGGGLG